MATLLSSPVGLTIRTPQDFIRKGNTWSRHRSLSIVEGVCPDCSGSETGSLHFCEAHDAADGTVCTDCGQRCDIQWTFVCDGCEFDLHVPGFFSIFTDTGVMAFYYDHGRDIEALVDAAAFNKVYDSIETVRVAAEGQLRVTVELEVDRLLRTLDAAPNVIEESSSEN